MVTSSVKATIIDTELHRAVVSSEILLQIALTITLRKIQETHVFCIDGRVAIQEARRIFAKFPQISRLALASAVHTLSVAPTGIHQVNQEIRFKFENLILVAALLSQVIVDQLGLR